MRKKLKNIDDICAISDYSELYKIREFITDKALRFGFSEEDAAKIVLAVDEACSNLVRHAYKFDKNQNICVHIETNLNQFIVNILDNGTPFNPLEVPEPDMKEYFIALKRGGLGIQLMRKVMDEIDYQPMNPQNNVNTLKLKNICLFNI
jgi:serine/threonine-protein kinase RsbW